MPAGFDLWCICANLFHHHATQRSFLFAAKLSFAVDPDNDHVTLMDSRWLRTACYCDQCRNVLITQGNLTFYDPQTTEIPRMDANELNTDEGKFKYVET